MTTKPSAYGCLSSPIVVCNEQHRFLVAEQLRQLDIESPSIVLEPMGRNTAPAIAIAAINALAQDSEAVLLVLPADHHVADVEALQAAINEALTIVNEGRLITFGLIPNRPETVMAIFDAVTGFRFD